MLSVYACCQSMHIVGLTSSGSIIYYLFLLEKRCAINQKQ